MYISLSNVKPNPPLTVEELKQKVHEFLKTLHRDHYTVVIERIGYDPGDPAPTSPSGVAA